MTFTFAFVLYRPTYIYSRLSVTVCCCFSPVHPSSVLNVEKHVIDEKKWHAFSFPTSPERYALFLLMGLKGWAGCRGICIHMSYVVMSIYVVVCIVVNLSIFATRYCVAAMVQWIWNMDRIHHRVAGSIPCL